MQDSTQKSSIITFLRTIPRTSGISSNSLAVRVSLLTVLFGFQLVLGRYTTYSFFQSMLLASTLLKTQRCLEAKYTLPFRQPTLHRTYFRTIGSIYRPYIRPYTFSLKGSSANYLLLYQLAAGLQICTPYRIYSKGSQQTTTFTSCA